MEELKAWFLEKVAPYARQDKPPKKHTNFYFEEHYFEFEKGKDTSVDTKVAESMQREGADMQAGTSMLALEDNKNKDKKDPELKQKAMISKVANMVKRLGTCISQTESSLPAIKRQASPQSFKQLRDGLSQARDFKEECLYYLDDVKAQGWVPESSEQIMDYLTDMLKDIQDHVQALGEATKQQGPIVKKDTEADDVADPDARLPIKITHLLSRCILFPAPRPPKCLSKCFFSPESPLTESFLFILC